MNGRIYDPTLGRFLQADPFIQAPTNSQSYNRYSYVLNNPLSYTDPSGYFFKAIGNLFKKALRTIAKVPILNLAAQAAACYFGGPWGCSAYSAASTYAVTGSLKAAFTAGIASAISPGGGSGGNIATTAIIGGLASKIQGGNFGHGFWSAGLGAGFAGRINTVNAYLNVATAAVIGGTVSKLTGGKFANGAQTWAFVAAMGQDWSKSSSNHANSPSCAKCGTVHLGDLSEQTYDQLVDIRNDLLETRSEEGLGNYNSVNIALEKVNKQIFKALAVDSFSKFDIQLTAMRMRMNTEWSPAFEYLDKAGGLAAYCSPNIICSAVGYGAAGIDYMRTGNTAGLKSNVTMEGVSLLLSPIPSPWRNFIQGQLAEELTDYYSEE